MSPVRDGTIEIQGDQRDRLAAVLGDMGYRVRRVGAEIAVRGKMKDEASYNCDFCGEESVVVLGAVGKVTRAEAEAQVVPAGAIYQYLTVPVGPGNVELQLELMAE